MNDSVRKLTRDDHPDALRLDLEAFGHPAGPTGGAPEIPPTPDTWPPAGQHFWGTFHDGRLGAVMAAREHHSWFDGVEVPSAGICDVTVAAEDRGAGLLGPLFEKVLTDAHARGDVISTLYPTAPGIYRRFGYEIVATLRQVEVPTALLAGVRPASSVWTRRAGSDDVPAIAQAYAAWAREQNGPLTRAAPLFDPAAVLTAGTATSVAVDADDRVVGYAVWNRGTGYGPEEVLEVKELVALHADANRALWRMIGTFASVTGRVRLRTSGDDVTRLSLPASDWRDVTTNPYMLRVLDVAGAFGLRSAPPGLEASLPFRVAGDSTGLIDGGYRLAVAAGSVDCATVDDSAAEPDVRTFTPQGLALAWAGAQSSADIRRAGHLSGDARDDRTWDALLGGRQVHIRDYF